MIFLNKEPDGVILSINVNEHVKLPWESLHWQIMFPHVKISNLKTKRWDGICSADLVSNSPRGVA